MYTKALSLNLGSTLEPPGSLKTPGHGGEKAVSKMEEEEVTEGWGESWGDPPRAES